MAFGSCRKQHKSQQIWRAVAALQPDLWLWTGDAVYPKPRSSPAAIRAAYVNASADADAQLLAKTVRHVDGVYDDHDYGENDGGRHYAGREAARQIFLDQIVRAPADSLRRSQPGGLYSARSFGEGPTALKLIMLDTRYSRDNHAVPSPGGSALLPKPGLIAAAVRLLSAVFGVATERGDMLGEEQWAWLERQLRNSTAAAHLIVSSVQACHLHRSAGTFSLTFSLAFSLTFSLPLGCPTCAASACAASAHPT